MGSHLSRDVEGFFDIWRPNCDVQVLEVKRRVGVTCDHLVRKHDFLHIHVDEVVERVDVLLD